MKGRGFCAHASQHRVNLACQIAIVYNMSTYCMLVKMQSDYKTVRPRLTQVDITGQHT